MFIRTLGNDEVEKWLDFLVCDVFPGDDRSMFENLWYQDRHKDFARIFVAVEGDVIASSLGVTKRYLDIGGMPIDIGIIYGVGTRKEFRKQGLARSLFLRCYEYMKEAGLHIAHLYSNPDTLRFYQQLGFLEAKQFERSEADQASRMFKLVSPILSDELQINGTEELMAVLSQEREIRCYS